MAQPPIKAPVKATLGQQPNSPRAGAKKLVTVSGVVARSKPSGMREDAWISLLTDRTDSHVLVEQFSADQYGADAFSKAVKRGKQLAERLGIDFFKKRGI